MRRMWMVAMAMVLASNAFAVNITIDDEHSSSPGWYGTQEDQEVEPGCITGQEWDLEGFFLNGLTLTMVGGYDFVAGIPGHGIPSGDLFIDIDGDAQYGAGAHAGAQYASSEIVSDTFGYDFVMNLDFDTLTYSVYDIASAGPGLQIITANEEINDEANPWRYLSGGAEVLTGGVIAYQSGLDDAAAQALGYDVTGGAHNIASVDLSWLTGALQGPFTAHFTMECGNDNLMGQSAVPEPATLVLLGLGLISVGLRKRMFA